MGRDLEVVEQLAPTVIGERDTSALACFVASDSDFGRAVRLPWSVRHRAFFEDRFVLWPLRQVLEQADRYAIILTDKDDARLFLFFMEQVEEIADVPDEVPGRIRFPDPLKNWHYSHKHIEYFHHYFERVAEAGLRLFEREPFEHLIVGGLSQLLPQFESHLHRYLSDRIVARWDIEVPHADAADFGAGPARGAASSSTARPGKSGRRSRTCGHSAGPRARRGVPRPLGAAGAGAAGGAGREAAGVSLSDVRTAESQRRHMRRMRRQDERGLGRLGRGGPRRH